MMSITKFKQLKDHIVFENGELRQLEKVIHTHPMNISHYYLSLINWDDPDDPIRKMSLPSIQELDIAGSYDTSGEHDNTKMSGLQHKYNETALILATNHCETYCRHCFRKRLVGLSNDEIISKFEEAIDYIREHRSITNVLITGGDAFSLNYHTLERFLDTLCDISHVNFIRLGTRVPVVAPDKVNSDLINVLKKNSYRKQIYIVTQFNHPKEITNQSERCIQRLISAGLIVSNQTVLLKGINNWPGTIIELMNGLVSIGVLPYYIFQCRSVKRVKNHFQIPIYEGCKILEKARIQLDGHAKRFRYIMSHKSGKIEILGKDLHYFFFKYHQAKNLDNYGHIFKRRINQTASWLDELKEG